MTKYQIIMTKVSRTIIRSSIDKLGPRVLEFLWHSGLGIRNYQ